MTDYKRIPLPKPVPIDKRADDAILALNKLFDADDFYVAREGDEVEVWLRQMNLNDLATAVARVESAYGNPDVMRGIFQAVEDVRSYGFNGHKRLYVGYNRERKVANRKGKELRRGKHFYANDNPFKRDENELPRNANDRIICGDSEDVLKDIPDNCVDLVLTSPPYNFGLGYGEADSSDSDAADWGAYFAKLFAVFDECIRVLKYGGRLVVNVQPLFSDYIPSHHIISNFLMERRMIWKGEILWEKNNYNCKYTAWGSWKSPSSPYLKYTWEFLEVFCKGNLKKKGNSANADIGADSFKEWVNAKWSIAPERRMRDYGHPAMFPEELARRVMLLFSFQGDTVLDPFNGVGTTTAVALQHGRHFLGIDTVEEYCDVARDRLSQAGRQGQFHA